MTRKASQFGKKVRLLVMALWRGLRIGSLKELIRLVKALTMSVFGREDEKSSSCLLFSLRVYNLAEIAV